MIINFFKKIEKQREKKLHRLVRREFYATLRDIETVAHNPSVDTDDLLPDLTDACTLLRDNGLAPADSAVRRRVGALTRTALSKITPWSHIEEGAWDTLVAVDPSLDAARAEYKQNIDNKVNCPRFNRPLAPI
jgi:hypothetical protein